MKERTLKEDRYSYHPVIPKQLQRIENIQFVQKAQKSTDPEITKMFPYTAAEAVLKCTFSKQQFQKKALKMGVLLSGGPAPGGHAVISAIYDLIKELHAEAELYGIIDGPKGLVEQKVRKLTGEEVKQYQNQGGFDLIGSSRTKIETEEDFQAAVKTIKLYALDGVIIIGGDDSNTNAALLAERCLAENVPTTIVGVPKTIDGDLQNEYLPISFGFDTACSVYSELIGNIMKDILSTKKYYFFVRLMGRAASHITLECALRTHPNLAFISEELQKKRCTLEDVVREIVLLIQEREANGKRYGIILIPEGLIEHLADIQEVLSVPNEKAEKILAKLPDEMRRLLLEERDAHGNIPVSQIETERLLVKLVEKRLKEIHPKSASWFMAQSAFYGYEGRCAYPTNFDITYAYTLGRMAALLVAHKKTGYLASCQNLLMSPHYWEPLALPLTSLLHYEMRKGIRKPVIQKSLVDLEGKAYKVLMQQRQKVRLDDCYLSPGPSQFHGSAAVTWRVPYIVEKGSMRELI